VLRVLPRRVAAYSPGGLLRCQRLSPRREIERATPAQPGGRGDVGSKSGGEVPAAACRRRSRGRGSASRDTPALLSCHAMSCQEWAAGAHSSAAGGARFLPRSTASRLPVVPALPPAGSGLNNEKFMSPVRNISHSVAPTVLSENSSSCSTCGRSPASRRSGGRQPGRGLAPFLHMRFRLDKSGKIEVMSMRGCAGILRVNGALGTLALILPLRLHDAPGLTAALPGCTRW